MEQKHDDQKRKFSLARALFAEAFGCFLLTFCDSFAAIADHLLDGKIGVVGKSIIPAIVVMTVIFLAGEVSGAHINPIVTLAFSLRRVFPWKRLPLYWLAQLGGAVLAGVLLQGLFTSNIFYGVTEPHSFITSSFAVELILSWFLVTSIVTSACASSLKGWEAAFPVGATLLFCSLLGKEISGASMNPARSFGVAVFVDMHHLWIYVLAPFVGALLGVLTAYALRGGPSQEEVKAAQGK